MSAPITAPAHEPITGGQVIMLFVFGLSFAVLCIWQVLLYLVPFFPVLAKRAPSGPAPVQDEESDDKEKEKERRDVLAIDQPSTWISIIHNEEYRNALHAFCSLGGLMLIFYLLDGPSPIFPQGERTYSRDTFIFVCAGIMLASLLCLTPSKDDKLMNRDVTDEWKGWMQIIFVLYHYFAAKETYNFIRNLIAGYVFLTGFGNYSFFYVKGDFGYKRVVKMLFRINFLVAMISITLNRSYMLYYICALHTWWFLVVYGTMAVYGSQNSNNTVAAVKFALLFILITFLYESKTIFDLVFLPVRFLLSYEGSLHEWWFRSGLDRYATVWGMLCAHFHPNLEAIMRDVEAMPPIKSYAIKGAVAAAALWATHWWSGTYLIPLDKFTYNAVHPYVSLVPIIGYIILRNLMPQWRSTHTWLFAFIGKISLESYLSQFHVWLGSDAKTIIWLIPDYPMLNFVVATGIFICIAHLLFQITCTLNDFWLPSNASNRVFVRNLLVLVCGVAVLGFAEHLQNLARGYLPASLAGDA